MISKDLDKINDLIFNTTTSEMKLALNEIANNLSLKSGTYENCIYWYLWLEKTENLKKNNNTIIFNNNNNNNNNENKYFDHWIFILWKILNNISDECVVEKNNLIYIKKIYNEYSKDFKLSQINNKKYYIFIVFYVIKNNVNWNINIFQNEYLIIQTNANINIMYENIIKNNESNLSEDDKKILYKNYNNAINNHINYMPKKIKNTNIDQDINIIMLTKYPDYKIISNDIPSNITENNKEETLISKNMTLRDIEEEKKEIKNKKIDALLNFVAYKKKEVKNKTVIDYYNEENNNDTNIKNINFSKRK